MFEIGDNIVYPMHGAGVIEAIEEKEMMGITQNYYVMAFPVKKLQVMIPVKKMGGSGMRLVLDTVAIEKAMNVFHEGELDRSLSYKQRYKLNSDKMKTGNVQDSAEVIRDLTLVEKDKPLNSNEKIMLREAKRFLTSELELSNGLTEHQAADLLNDRIHVENH